MARGPLPPSLRRGRRQAFLGGILSIGGNKGLDEIAKDLRATANSMKEIGLNRSFLMMRIRRKPEVMSELLDAWIEALYGSSPLTSWYQKTRPKTMRGVAGGPNLGVPVDSGKLQASLTMETAEGAIHEVTIGKDAKLRFRYGAAPQTEFVPFVTDKGWIITNMGFDPSDNPDPDSSYIDEINQFYSEGGVGFFEVGLADMGKSERLKDFRSQVAKILKREAAAYIAERKR
jgi:hypothetical protein